MGGIRKDWKAAKVSSSPTTHIQEMSLNYCISCVTLLLKLESYRFGIHSWATPKPKNWDPLPIKLDAQRLIRPIFAALPDLSITTNVTLTLPRLWTKNERLLTDLIICVKWEEHLYPSIYLQNLLNPFRKSQGYL